MKKKFVIGNLLLRRLQKFLLFMALKVFILFVAFTSVQAVGISQQKMDVNFTRVSVEEVLGFLNKETGLQFIYKTDLFHGVTVDRLNKKEASLGEILDVLLRERGFDYQIAEDVVLIRLQAPATPQVQEFRVEGKVSDGKKQPLPGVTIRVEGTASVGTATGKDGSFTLRLPVEKGNLIFSFVGFKTQTVAFESGKTLNIIMEEDVSDLEEVVVRAYGTQNKREMISAISSVKAEEMKELPSASILSMLQGRMAGVNIVNQSGAPGSAAMVAVRGFNSLLYTDSNTQTALSSDGQPLYVVDGMPMHSFVSPVTGTNTLADLDPTMIESVEVLKDAAAATIYGSRAGNGVILITTKKGRAGHNIFSANASYSISQLMEYPLQTGGRLERWFDLQQHRNARTRYYQNGLYYYPNSYKEVWDANAGSYDRFWGTGRWGVTDPVLQDSLDPTFNNSTNWWKYVFRTGEVLNTNLQASGGSDRFQYMVGAGYYKEKGIMINSSYARINAITNLTVKPIERMKLDTRFYISYVDRSVNAGNGLGGNGLNHGRFEGITVDPSQKRTLERAGAVALDEWLKAMNQTVVRSDDYRLMSSFLLEYQLLKRLTFSASANVDYSQSNLNRFTPSTLSPYDHENTSEGQSSRTISLLTEELLRYNVSFKEAHHVDLLLGFNANKGQTFTIGGSGRRGASDYIYYYNPGVNIPIYNYGSEQYPYWRSTTTYHSGFREKAMVSYFGRFGYNYKQRYLVEVAFRRDGSSTFGEGNRWANFPSIAAGWAFSEEPFLGNLTWLSWGKLRASYGTSGQVFTDEYLAHGLMTQEMGNSFQGEPGVVAKEAISPDLTWEKTKQYNVGLDMDLFDYRLGVKMDYYYKLTGSLIYDFPAPGDFNAFGSRTENGLEVSNEGIEIELQGDILRESAVSWRMKLNGSHNWNQFRKSYNNKDVKQWILGKPLYQMSIYKDDGLYQNESEVPVYYKADGNPVYFGGNSTLKGVSGLVGTHKIIDLNGDGSSSYADRYYGGSPLPTVNGGWVNELKWKNWTLNVLCNYVLGRSIIRTNTSSIMQEGPKFVDLRTVQLWKKEGDTGFPRMGTFINTDVKSNIKRADYLSLKQITLGYDLPRELLAVAHLSGARFFFTGENLFVLTGYEGSNPEVVDVYSGYDTGRAYPLPRKWTLGVTLNF